MSNGVAGMYTMAATKIVVVFLKKRQIQTVQGAQFHKFFLAFFFQRKAQVGGQIQGSVLLRAVRKASGECDVRKAIVGIVRKKGSCTSGSY